MNLFDLRDTDATLQIGPNVVQSHAVEMNARDQRRRAAAKNRARSAESSNRERFQRFHERNPHVYRELVVLARRIRDAGLKRYSIKGLFEVLRYETHLRTCDPEQPFKLANAHTAYYARLIMAQEPDLADFFQTAELRSL